MTRKWNNLSKRGLALFLALVMCLGMLPAAAFAAGEETTVCPDCDGSGKVSVTSECPDCEEPPVCDVCHGTHAVKTTEPCPDCADAEEPPVCETCGGSREVKITEPCPDCADAEEPVDCATCGGTKQVKDTEPCAACADWTEPETCATCGGTRKVTTTEDCATCEGAGTVERTCPECNGTGEVTVKHEEPQVPAEVQAFLDAVDALPDASTVTKDNAVEIGAQVDKVMNMVDLDIPMDFYVAYQTEIEDALNNVVYPLYAAVNAAKDGDGDGQGDGDEGGFYVSDEDVNATISAFHAVNGEGTNYLENVNDFYGLQAVDGSLLYSDGSIDLDGEHTVVDGGPIYLFPNLYWFGETFSTTEPVTDFNYVQVSQYTFGYDGYPKTTLHNGESVSLDNGATVTVNWTNGYPGKIYFTFSSAEALTDFDIYIKVNFSFGQQNHSGKTFTGDTVFYYGKGSAPRIMPPTRDDVTDIPVYVKCKQKPNETSNHYVWGYLYSNNSYYVDDTAYSFGPVIANDGRDSEAPKNIFTHMCLVTMNQAEWLKMFEKVHGTSPAHSLYDPDTDVVLPLYYTDGTKGYTKGWYNNDADWKNHKLCVWVTENTTYTLNYNANGGTGAPDAQTYTGSESSHEFTISETEPSKNGYAFLGWSDTANGTVKYKHGETGKDTVTVAKAETPKTIYAVWEKIDPKTVTVSKVAKDSDQSIAKQVTEVNVDENFVYWITVSNANSAAVKVTITDKLPEKLTWVGAGDGGSYDEATHTVTWTNITVSANGNKEVKVTVTAKEAGKITNSATATWPDCEKDPEGKAPDVTATQDAAITNFTKEVMRQYAATQAGLNVTGISFPNYEGGPLTFYNNAVEGTLLYKITVAGDAGAAYTVTDEGATWVQGETKHETDANGVLTVTGTIPENQTEAVIYVTKLFTQSDIKFNSDKSCYVENTATVTPGKDGADSTDVTATTQLTPFTVNGLKITKAFVGLTEAQIPSDFQMTYTVAANNDPSVVYAEGTLKLTGGNITPTVTKDEATKTTTYTWAIPQYTRPTSLQTDLTITETEYTVENYSCTSAATKYTIQGVTNGTVVYSLGMNDASPERGIVNTYTANTTTVTVEKKFEGLTADKIPGGFALEYSFDGGTTQAGTLNKDTTGLTKSTDGLTWTWTVSVPNGKTLTLKEVGADVDGYTLTTTTTKGSAYAGGITGSGGDLTGVDSTAARLGPDDVPSGGGNHTGDADSTITMTPGDFTVGTTKVTITNKYEKNPNPKLTGIEKKLVEGDIPANLTLPDGVTLSKKDNGRYVADGEGKVTLLYKITVKGEANANYIVTDTGATWVGGDGTKQTDGTITGTINANGDDAFIYVVKTFGNITTDTQVANQAFVKPGANTDPVAPDEPNGHPSDPVNTDVKKGNPSLKVDKTMGKKSTNDDGERIVPFTVTVTNNGNVSLYNLMLVDTMDKTLEVVGDMENVHVSVYGKDDNKTDLNADDDLVGLMGIWSPKAPKRDDAGHIVWNKDGSLTRETGGEDKWDFTWGLGGEFKPGMTVTLTYDAKIIYPEGESKVVYYNYADAIAGTTEYDRPKYDNPDYPALYDFATGSSGGVGSGGSGAVGGEDYRFTLTYDFTGGMWDGHRDTYTVDAYSDKDQFYQFTVDAKVQPEKSGFVFAGKWNDADGREIKESDLLATTAKANITIYAVWNAVPGVTFDPNGGHWTENGKDITTPKTVNIENGNVAAPADPKQDNKVFDGWYTERTGGNKVDVETAKFTEATTLYAHWDDDYLVDPTVPEGERPENGDGIPDKYQVTVTFTSKGKTATLNNGDGPVTTVVTLYKEGSTTEYAENGTGKLAASQIPSVAKKDNTYGDTASWTVDSNTVAAPAEGTAITKNVTFNVEYTPKDATVTYPKYEDGKLPTDKDQTDGVKDGVIIIVDLNSAQDVQANWTGKAGWTAQSDNDHYNRTAKSGDKISLRPNPTMTGYVFMGWSGPEIKTQGSTTTYTYTAVWEPDAYGPTPDDPSTPDNESNPTKKDGSDGIPDKFQPVVTYHVVNGTWDSTHSSVDLTYVYSLKDADGNDVEAKFIRPEATANTDKEYDNGVWGDSTPAAGTDVTTDMNGQTYTLTFTAKDTYTVTYHYIDADGKDTKVDGTPVTDPATVNPAQTVKYPGTNGKDYVLDEVKTDSEKKTIDVYYDLDAYGPTKTDDPNTPGDESDPTWKEGPDGIADKFQPVVTYKVKNGSWNDGENDKADKKVVVTLKDGSGEPSLDGTATLSAPAVGDKPDTGFKAGGWDTDPKDVAFNKDSAKEYTYTYAGDSKVTYPEYKEEDGKPVAPEDKTDEVNKDTVIIVDPNGGTWTPTDAGKWTEENGTHKHKVAEGETVSLTPDPTREGYVFVGWKKDGPEEVDGTTTITYTAQWAEDKKYDKDDPTKEGSDGIPDVWQAKVTLSIQDGTWNASNGWTPVGNTRVKVFDLYTQNEGKWSKVDNVTVGTLPTSTANANYTGGSWTPGLATDTKVTGDASYTLSFSPVGYTTYTLSYNANNGSGAPSSWSVTVLTGSGARTTTVSTTRPSRSGYTFQGWNTAANGSGTAYGAGDSITLAGNVILYAQWSYNGGGGGGGTYRPSTGGGGGGGTGGGTVNIDDPDVPLAGGSELNREDHFAYISGYPDGTVQPTNNITREEVAAIFYRLLTDTSRTIYETDVNDFSDVDSGRWSNRAISTLVNAGILSGYPDGTFRPGQSITRAEFATIAAQFEVVTEDVENPFSDTTGHWAETLISFAASKGWVGGYTDGTFKPQRAITRAEAMTLVNNVLEREVDEEGLLADAKQWPDNKKDAWYYYEVLEATNSHDYTRRGSGTVENWTAITTK